MLKVGLTGGLGSGKSTVAAMLRKLGAQVIEADTLGRALMEPGQPVYAEIVRVFGPQVVNPDGRLNRTSLAGLAFREGRLQQLNAIVHPPVVEAEGRWMNEIAGRDPSAIAVVESALIFEVVRDARARGEKESVLADWRRRIDRIVVVTAPDALKIARYVARIQSLGAGTAPAAASREGIAASAPGGRSSSPAFESEARIRLSHQVPDAEKAAQADYVLDNSGDIAALQAQVNALWPRLQAENNKSRQDLSLK